MSLRATIGFASEIKFPPTPLRDLHRRPWRLFPLGCRALGAPGQIGGPTGLQVSLLSLRVGVITAFNILGNNDLLLMTRGAVAR